MARSGTCHSGICQLLQNGGVAGPEPTEDAASQNEGSWSTSESEAVSARVETADGNGEDGAVAPKKPLLKRLDEGRPSSFVLLVLFGVLAVLSIAGSVAFAESAFGLLCAVGFVPGLSILIGIAGTHWYSKRDLAEQLEKTVQIARYTTLHLESSVAYVDDRLSDAYEQIAQGEFSDALLEVVRAKTASELSIGTARLSSRQWAVISPTGAQVAASYFGQDANEMRPRIKLGNNPKVATVTNEAVGGNDSE